jgi:integrase
MLVGFLLPFLRCSSTVVVMKQRNTVQKDGAPTIDPATAPVKEGQTHLQGANSFNQTPDAYLQGADSFNRRKVWNSTSRPNLLRHKSGRYYARVYAGGKEVWKSLKTSHFQVAQARLAEFLKDHRQRVSNGGGGGGKDTGVSAKMTFGEAMTSHLRDLDNNVKIKPRTRAYYRERLRALEKSWPNLRKTEIRKITAGDCKAWAGAYSKAVSPINYNNTLALLRHVLAVAIEAGVIYADPAAALKRAAVRGKEIALPSMGGFNALIAQMRGNGSRRSCDCADFALGLAVTGMRKGEANTLQWRDLDFTANEIVVRGDAVTGTKGGEGWRRVPMIPDARALFERLRSERKGEPLDAKVFRVRECPNALTSACKKVGTARIVHHDLRHLFATRCIESGVDIPTVSRWLGHRDGGALAMKTYGHLRREHSQSQAQKVSFTSVPKSADIVPFSSGGVK